MRRGHTLDEAPNLTVLREHRLHRRVRLDVAGLPVARQQLVLLVTKVRLAQTCPDHQEALYDRLRVGARLLGGTAQLLRLHEQVAVLARNGLEAGMSNESHG
jgi:hypothetical protein